MGRLSPVAKLVVAVLTAVAGAAETGGDWRVIVSGAVGAFLVWLTPNTPA